jgi:hypothetical protein
MMTSSFIFIDNEQYVIGMTKSSPTFKEITTVASCLLTKYKTKLFDENAAECSVKLSFMTSNDNVQNADDLAISNDKGPGKCSLQHIYRYPTIPSSDITTDKRPRICFGIPSMTRQRIPNISDLPIMKTFLASVFETIKKDSGKKIIYFTKLIF